MMKRRTFLSQSALAALPLFTQLSVADERSEPRASTRGVVLYPFDLSLADWPERCAQAGINTIGLHAARRLDVLLDFVQSDRGQDFLSP
jgi:hypothetical protein